jgi:probable phosphoglycerate mutase
VDHEREQRLTLLLVRHGETLFNHRELVQGWVDSPLTPRGVEQARQVAARLRGRPLVAAYSSTSERAVDTAEVILEQHPHLQLARRRGLKELHFGEFEAIPNAEFLARIDVESFFAGVLAGDGTGVPGGEDGATYRRRVDAAFGEIIGNHPDGGEVLVVSHGVTIGTYLSTVGWATPGPLANVSISVVTVRAGRRPRLVAVGLEDVTELLPPPARR